VVVHWTGSEGGNQSATAPTNNPVTVTFFPTNAVATGGIIPQSNSTVAASTAIAFSDTDPSSSLFYHNKAGDGRYYGNAAAVSNVAVQGFAYFGSTGFPATNISAENIRSLYSSGAIPLSLITGTPSDSNNAVFAIGRNIDSGTRVVTQGVSGVGFTGTSYQYQIITTDSPVDAQLYPVEAIDGYTNTYVGQSGYGSTGSLLGVLAATYQTGSSFDVNGDYAVSYTGSNYLVGYAAATKIPTAGTVALNYNGVAPTSANIINGSYPLWAFERVVLSPYYTNSDSSTVFSSLVTYIRGLTTTQLNNGAANGNASLSDVNANLSRTTDAGVITSSH